MISLVDHVEHDGTWTKIERHAVADVEIGIAGQGRTQSSLLDAVHANRGAGWSASNNLPVAPETVVRNNRGQTVRMNDVINLRFSGCRHGQSSNSPDHFAYQAGRGCADQPLQAKSHSLMSVATSVSFTQACNRYARCSNLPSHSARASVPSRRNMDFRPSRSTTTMSSGSKQSTNAVD